MLRQKYLFIVLSLILAFNPCKKVYAALVIEPALIKLNLTQKRTSGVFFIKNVGDKEERYRATAVHFTVNEKGGLSLIAADEYSLANWIKFNPTEFVLPPKSSRMVRYSVIPQGKLKNREYWGAIQFVPLKGNKFKSTQKEGQIIGLEVMTVILVPIYGLVEGTPNAGRIKQLEAVRQKDGLKINCSVLNTGEGVLRLTGSYQLINSAGTVIKELEINKFVIFPKMARLMISEIKDKLKPDKYFLNVKLKSTDKKIILNGETELIYEKQ